MLRKSVLLCRQLTGTPRSLTSAARFAGPLRRSSFFSTNAASESLSDLAAKKKELEENISSLERSISESLVLVQAQVLMARRELSLAEKKLVEADLGLKNFNATAPTERKLFEDLRESALKDRATAQEKLEKAREEERRNSCYYGACHL
jgi:hypothetical protein